jgi:hypothetical protein
MESLESRMERLTPEQRREVEDFVDFLLLKNNFREPPQTASPPPPFMMSTPPVLTADPVSSLLHSPARMQDLVVQEESKPPMVVDEPAPPPINEITAGGEDWITRDYMDYGRFEEAPSPATEAVKNVKRKIIAREAKDKSGHMLDWVD